MEKRAKSAQSFYLVQNGGSLKTNYNVCLKSARKSYYNRGSKKFDKECIRYKRGY